MTQDYARKFAIQLSIGAAILALLPAILAATMFAPSGSSYLGMQYNVDDHMVYAAWMRQAMAGNFLFDNRFAVDAQPGLTIHLYFFVLGLVAKVTGIPLAMAIARAIFSGLFVWLTYRLISRITQDIYTVKLALSLVVFGGGIGFFVWQTFGNTFSLDSPLSGIMLSRLPTDVWQPEGFVFPSMLTNGLFMVSLCLIMSIFIAVLDARESWKPVGIGALWFLLLMNIHSYDMLLVGFVLVGLLAMSVVSKQVETKWVLRVFVMALGAVPAALWFVYVLRNDPVFQARAATETFSPNFRQVVFGYLLLIGFGIASLFLNRDGEEKVQRRTFGAVGLALLILIGFVMAAEHLKDGYWMGLAAWIPLFVLAIAGIATLARKEPAWNLVAAWAFIGLIAPYFPSLFQRKLLMGLAIPWAILAALGLSILLQRLDRGPRNLATILAIFVLCATSIRWVSREMILAREDISNTTMHAVYLTRDMRAITTALNKGTFDRRIAIAMPGVNAPVADRKDAFLLVIPDLNPILSGLTGVYTYAGHWSETPQYLDRRNEATRLFLASTADDERASLLEKMKADYLIAPDPDTFNRYLGEARLADLRALGEVVVDGTQFDLIKLR